MESPGPDVHPVRIDVGHIASADVSVLGDTALAHCLSTVLDPDECGESEVPAWDSFVS